MEGFAHRSEDIPGFSLGDLDVPLAIIQGGMGVGVSLAGLAAAVAAEGGIGVISAAGIGMRRPEFLQAPLATNLQALRDEIRTARARTRGVLGVNIMVALSDYLEYARAAAEEGIDVIFSGAGLPMQLPEVLPAGSRTRLVPIMSSARATLTLCRRWQRRYNMLPDAIVIEGPLAGGHLGFSREQIDDPGFRLENLLAEVRDALAPYAQLHGRPVPLIAAGGIFTGEDICRYLDMGAAAVQMGTRFVGTHECDASPVFKQAYLDCREGDLRIIDSPIGLPGRAIGNAWLDRLVAVKPRGLSCPYSCITSCQRERASYCIALALLNAQRGDLARGFAFAGANAYRVQEIVSVHGLVQALREEYRHAARCSKRQFQAV